MRHVSVAYWAWLIKVNVMETALLKTRWRIWDLIQLF